MIDDDINNTLVGNELPNGNIIFTYNDEQNKRVCD